MQSITKTSFIKEIFSSTEKTIGSTLTGLATLYAPVAYPLLSLTAIIVVNTYYKVKVNVRRNKRHTALTEAKNSLYKIKDAIFLVLCGFTLNHFIITSVDLHCMEFLTGAIAFVEFWSLINNLSRLHPEWGIWKILKLLVKRKSEQILNIDIEKELTDVTNTDKSN